jgi:hypothetical protein
MIENAKIYVCLHVYSDSDNSDVTKKSIWDARKAMSLRVIFVSCQNIDIEPER